MYSTKKFLRCNELFSSGFMVFQKQHGTEAFNIPRNKCNKTMRVADILIECMNRDTVRKKYIKGYIKINHAIIIQ